MQRAKQATAVEAACQFLSNALRLMPTETDLLPVKPEGYSDADINDPSYVFTFDFLVLRAECEAGCGAASTAAHIIEYLLQRGRCLKDRVRACVLNCIVNEATANFHGSVKVL